MLGNLEYDRYTYPLSLLCLTNSGTLRTLRVYTARANDSNEPRLGE